MVVKLNAAVVAALADAGVSARLAELGQEIFPRDQQTPEALRAVTRSVTLDAPISATTILVLPAA